MASEVVPAVKDAVHKLQLCLLEGINDDNQLFAAGSLLSRSDYQDVVTERTISSMCGYPLCSNSLPSERPRKGHYRISLKEHKVYDLHETYMYCSTNCVVNSRAFAGSLLDERSDTLNPAKLNEVLKLFEGLHLHSTEDMKVNRVRNLKIQEKVDIQGGEVSVEEWMGPSNAIEGYVPLRDRRRKPPPVKNVNKDACKLAGSKNKHAEFQNEKNVILNEMNFSSIIMTQDEYSISKLPTPVNAISSKQFKEAQTETSREVKDCGVSSLSKQVDALQLHSREKTEKSDKNGRTFKDDLNYNSGEVSCQQDVKNKSVMSGAGRENAPDGTREKQSLRSSLKSSNSKKMARSVTWADEHIHDDGIGKKTESSSKTSEDGNQVYGESGSTDMEEDDDSYRFASAEACAAALSQAAEAVASGSDVPDAVSEAGIIILPPPQEVDEAKLQENDEMLDTEPAPVKWPRKPGMSKYDVFESEDSWFDSPPKEFNLTLSPFATMFNSLFTWISSSSLAYIYGHNESSSEEYLSVNGREYPRKIVLSDGRSTEIKQTLDGCLARALPELVADLRLSVPISILEYGLTRLIDTMSFVDPLPAFRMKQWQLIILLFLDALSVCRIPALTSYITGRRTFLPKVLDGAQISTEEYEILKDLLIPLGRVPQFSMQSGG